MRFLLGLTAFADYVLKHLLAQRQVRDKLPQLRIFVLHALQRLNFCWKQATINARPKKSRVKFKNPFGSKYNAI